jgi:flagellar biosynthesis/type III secretory pathway chaperone
VDATVCREALAALLTQEIASLAELAGLLEHEHALLAGNDADALEAAMKQRHAAIGKLLRIEDERRDLCRMHGRAPDIKGLEQLLAWCDPHGTLAAPWADCAQSATRCRELNDRNGALVVARMNRVDSQLGALSGRSASQQTYGPKGSYGALHSGRRLAFEA